MEAAAEIKCLDGATGTIRLYGFVIFEIKLKTP